MAILAALAALAIPAAAAMTSVEFDKLQASANSGNGDSAFQLGRVYKLGDDVPADLDKAEHWFERAVKLGNARAGAELGLVLAQNGKGAAALPWLKAAAEKGDARAQYALGALLFGGQGVAVDAARGREWMRQAARTGLPAAIEALAIMDKALLPPASPARPYEIVSLQPQSPPPRQEPRAAKPDTKPAAAPVRPPSAGTAWYAQLGAFAVSGNAQRYWKAVKPGLPPQLGPRFPVSGPVTRLLVGPFGDRSEAAGFCAAQRKRDRQCLEVKGAG